MIAFHFLREDSELFLSTAINSTPSISSDLPTLVYTVRLRSPMLVRPEIVKRLCGLRLFLSSQNLFLLSAFTRLKSLKSQLSYPLLSI